MSQTHSRLFLQRFRKLWLALLLGSLCTLFGSFFAGSLPQAHASAYACIHCSYVVDYIHQTNVTNTQSYYTELNNTYLNNNPQAQIIVTQNWTPFGDNEDTGADTNNVGVWYHNGQWAIFNEDHAPMSTDVAFNVYASINTNTSFVQTATAANSAYDYTDIDNALTDNQPNAQLFVTQNWNPDGSVTGQYDDHPLGVWYHNGKWSIFNEDGTAIPVNASFNVVVQPATQASLFVQTATAANNTSDGGTCMNDPAINFNQNAVVFATPNWELGTQYVPHSLTVDYRADLNEWCIYTIGASPIPVGAAFNVFS